MKNLTVQNVYNKFTIQNVPIKLKKTQLWWAMGKIFTIQNVPIKLYLTITIKIKYRNLQYKMFLLNLD